MIRLWRQRRGAEDLAPAALAPRCAAHLTSLTFLVLLVGLQPATAGRKITRTLTFTLPRLLSFLSARPFALTRRRATPRRLSFFADRRTCFEPRRITRPGAPTRTLRIPKPFLRIARNLPSFRYAFAHVADPAAGGGEGPAAGGGLGRTVEAD